jgi:hypothetical protein
MADAQPRAQVLVALRVFGVELARRSGAHTVELNLEPSGGAHLFAKGLYGPATEIVPDFVATLLRRGRD